MDVRDAGASPPKGGRRQAIVCDDDPMVRRIVVALLQRCGYDSVEGTALASEAVDLAEAMQPSVIVLDLSLEEESGVEAIPQLRKVAPATPIVVYSSAETQKALAKGADVYAVVDKWSMASIGNLEQAIRSLDEAR